MNLRLLRLAMVSCLVIMASAAQFNVAAQSYQWDIPQWVPVPVVPDDNPMTDQKVELGRHLFYDKRLSADQTMSCATCHHQDKAFTDGRRFAKGISGQQAIRNAMSLTNVAYLPVLTWSNPLLTSMEAQVLIPLFGEHPVEMGGGRILLVDGDPEEVRGDVDHARLPDGFGLKGAEHTFGCA